MHNKIQTVLKRGHLEDAATFSQNPVCIRRELKYTRSICLAVRSGVIAGAAGYFYQTVHKQLCVSQSDKLAALFTTHFLQSFHTLPGVQVGEFDTRVPLFRWGLLIKAVYAVIFPLCSFFFLSVMSSSSILSANKDRYELTGEPRRHWGWEKFYPVTSEC